jgi:hypothetical protein
MKDVVFTYVKNGPLVEPAQEEDLPRQMKGLLNWYKGYIKLKNAKDYIYANVKDWLKLSLHSFLSLVEVFGISSLG